MRQGKKKEKKKKKARRARVHLPAATDKERERESEREEPARGPFFCVCAQMCVLFGFIRRGVARS